MTILSVHAYDSPRTAARRIGLLEPGASRRVIADDIAVITWPAGVDRPDAWQVAPMGLHPCRGRSGVRLCPSVPHPLSYAQPPSIALEDCDRVLAPLGLTTDHVVAIRSLVTVGTSAVFVVHPDAIADAIAALLRCDDRKRIQITLDPRQSRRLLAGFSEDQD